MPVDDPEDRASLLDAFAKTEIIAPASVPATAAEFATAGGRVIGAQKIAVPREIEKIFLSLKTLAARAGEDWYYRYPVRKKIKDEKTGKETWVVEYIEGHSIKLANDLARTYGNCEVDTRAIDFGDSWMFYARFTDYESGYSLTRPFQQYKSQKSLKTDADRAGQIAFAIGASKAQRNVTVNALQTFADFAFEEAKDALVGKIGKDLANWRAKTIAKLEAKVDIKRVEAVLGRTAPEWLAPDVSQAIAMMKAVQDGMAALDETFPPLAPPPGEAQPAADKLDEFASDSGASAAPPVEAERRPPDEAAAGGANPRPPAAADPSTRGPGHGRS
jgi:hypothetical protein